MNAPAEETMMTIGAFARATRLSVKALRLYEHHQLLEPAEVDKDSGYRYYRPDQLDQARLIARLRELAMPLQTVASVLSAGDDAETDRQIAFWWAGVEHDTTVRRGLVQSLRRDIAPKPGPDRQPAPARWRPAERSVPERLVLTVQQNTSVADLPGVIGACIQRLIALAPTAAATAGYPVTVVYLGRVNEDSDGPIEVCLPLEAERRAELPAGVGMRREPERRELFVTLTKRQVVYPDILSAYDALETSARLSRLTVTGPPREHYVADLNAADPDDEVCHAALPIR